LSLLLDTQVVIWLSTAPERISPAAMDRIGDPVETLHVSFVSGWEYGIKRLKHPRQMPIPFETLLLPIYVRLGLDFESYVHAERLPPIHRDPFDRMLVAQALDHGLALVTSDDKLRRYPVETIW